MRKLRYREVLILIRREKHSSSPQILTEALQVGAEIRAIQLDTVIATLLCSDSQRQSQETTTQKHRTIHTVTQT